MQVLMQGVDHPETPPQKACTRADIIFSVNLLREIETDTESTESAEGTVEPQHPQSPTQSDTETPTRTKARTELITISHMSYPGVFPFLVNQRAHQGIIDYMTALDRFATKQTQE